jgi:hypothetical protein
MARQSPCDNIGHYSLLPVNNNATRALHGGRWDLVVLYFYSRVAVVPSVTSKMAYLIDIKA